MKDVCYHGMNAATTILWTHIEMQCTKRKLTWSYMS